MAFFSSALKLITVSCSYRASFMVFSSFCQGMIFILPEVCISYPNKYVLPEAERKRGEG